LILGRSCELSILIIQKNCERNALYNWEALPTNAKKMIINIQMDVAAGLRGLVVCLGFVWMEEEDEEE
jgi:hypothetical protein